MALYQHCIGSILGAPYTILRQYPYCEQTISDSNVSALYRLDIKCTIYDTAPISILCANDIQPIYNLYCSIVSVYTEHLNTIFQDTINTDDNYTLNYPSFYIFQEKYIDISSVESLTFNGNEFLIVCVNMRSIVNLLNFSKLEAFIHNLKMKPDIIAVTET